MELPWNEVDKLLSGLATDLPHKTEVRRESIPLIFVPGIMGSRLRLSGTNGEGEGSDGLPNLRWEPSAGWLFTNCSGKEPEHRRRLLIGPDNAKFQADYLEVDNDTPVADGFRGIMEDYRPFLKQLRKRDWGALAKLFEFPVHAFGYNWTGDAALAGSKLVARIDEIIAEAKQVTGRCEKVILISHSMGGLVTRAASTLAGGEGKILGIVHGVQPAWGAAAAYWRIKAGFEGGGIAGRIASRFLGSSGPHTTHPDPYTDIYRVKAEVAKPKTGNPSTNTWWGLVDPTLLNPGIVSGDAGAANEWDNLAENKRDLWPLYLELLAVAEGFHTALGSDFHPATYSFHGTKLHTAEYIRFDVETNSVWSDPYRTRGFLGFYRNSQGQDMQAVLQDPVGSGDGTVPVASALFLGASLAKLSGDPPQQRAFDDLEHQPAFEESDPRRYTVSAITALVALRYAALRGA